MNNDTANSEPRRSLRCMLDDIIPASGDGRLPGAGAILSASDPGDAAQDRLGLATLQRGLAALDSRAHSLTSHLFADGSTEERLQLLHQFAGEEPALFQDLVRYIYGRYYQHPAVVEALGLDSAPPYPTGYRVEAFDLALLDGPRAREKFYRKI